MDISLLKHNTEADEAVLLILAESGKAAVVHPIGKSIIAFQLCADPSVQTICWRALSKYIFETQFENLKAVSDRYEPENLKLLTYAKLTPMSENDNIETASDYIILDKFHCCGSSFWKQGIWNFLNAYPNAPIPGLFVTNVRYLNNRRDMADKRFDDNITSEVTLGDAIVRNTLPPLKYVLWVYFCQQDLEKYQKRVYHAQSRILKGMAESWLESLHRSLKKADGADVISEEHVPAQNGKYITFCANEEHLDGIIAYVSNCFRKIDAVPTSTQHISATQKPVKHLQVSRQPIPITSSFCSLLICSTRVSTWMASPVSFSSAPRCPPSCMNSRLDVPC